MHVRERMIRERVATQPCEGCGRTYGVGTLLVLVRRPSVWLVLAACGQCERRRILLVSFRGASVELAGSPLDDGAMAPRPRQPSAPTTRVPITDEDVGAMHAFLARFDGDFQRLFASDGLPPA